MILCYQPNHFLSMCCQPTSLFFPTAQRIYEVIAGNSRSYCTSCPLISASVFLSSACSLYPTSGVPLPWPVKVDSLALCRRLVKRGKVSSEGSPRWAAPWSCSCVVGWAPAPSRPRWLSLDVAPKAWSAEETKNKKTSSSHVLTSWTKTQLSTIPWEAVIYGYISDTRGIKYNPKSCSVINVNHCRVAYYF